MKKRIILLVALGLFALIFSGCGEKGDGKTKVEFFTTKPETVELMDELIAEFEEQNPDIDIEQNFTPEAETALKARLAKNDIPDIIAMGGTFSYGEVVRAGVLMDMTGTPEVEKVQEAYSKMLEDLHPEKKGQYGIPFAANANTVLYNKNKFDELGLEIPKTWDELIAVCEKIKAKGETPFYLTLKDAWTAQVPFNSLASNIQSPNFIEKRKAGKTTFKAEYSDVAKKIYKLTEYGHDDNFGMGYNEGNAAFAKGDSVMYLQGVWAINSIQSANPDIEIGAFALPALNESNENKLISGVDTVLAISKGTKHPEEAKKFINFLLEKEVSQKYIDDQKLFSAVKGVYQEDPTVVDLKEYFQSGRLASFVDHYYPSGMQIGNLLQEFLLDGDKKAFLNKLDGEWDKVQARH